MESENGSEDGINILIKRAYIERLEIDLVDKIKLVWYDFLDAVGKAWDWVLGIDNNKKLEADKNEESK